MFDFLNFSIVHFREDSWLLSLPEELIVAILSLVPLGSRLRASSTSTAFLKYSMASITDLDLQEYRHAVNDASQIAGLLKRLPHITRLGLKRCFKIQVSSLFQWDQQFLRLLDLDVIGAKLTNSAEEARFIFSKVPNLEEINFGLFDSMTDDYLDIVGQCCPKLRRLWIGGCRLISSAGIQKITSQCPNLNNFNFCACYTLDGELLSILTQFCPNTTSLDVSSCPSTLENIASISNLRFLKRLSLRILPVTDADVSRIAQGCRLLEYLNLGYCTLLKDSSLVEISKYCTELRTANLWRCTGFTSEGLMPLVLQCKHLKTLDISGWATDVNDDLMKWISENSSSIERIHLQESFDLTDLGVASIAKLPLLRHLDIFRCDKVTDDGIYAVAHQTTQLRALNCSGCPRITFRSLKYICERCPLLTPWSEGDSYGK